VYSGHLSTGESILNVSRGRRERIGRLVRMHANKREELTEVMAGDIAACVGLRSVATGTRFAPRSTRCCWSRLISRAGDSAGHRNRRRGRPGKSWGSPSRNWCRKIPRCGFSTDHETGQTILRDGELHLEIIVDRLQREFNVGANVGKPQVAYRETVRKAAEGEGRFIRQTAAMGSMAT